MQDVGVAVVDFQWSGWGLPVLDVVYVLFTSVQPDVIKQSEEELLRFYYHALQQQLSQKIIEIFEWKTFLEWYQIAYLDYVRFLVGSMWGNVTETSIAQNCNSINQGMHKRDKSHLLFMIAKTATLMQAYDTKRSQQQPSLVVAILNEAVKVAQIAGEEICHIINSDQSLRIKDKGRAGPQTIADRTAEHIIINHLSKIFPNLKIIGEEGSSSRGYSNHEILERKIAASPDIVLNCLSRDDGYEGTDLSDITVWVDPLDGTRELINENYLGVTVLIGIAVRGRPVAGVVHQPFRESLDGCQSGRLWWGQIGEGVFIGPHKYTMDDRQDSKRCIVATTRTWAAWLPDNLVQQLNPQQILNVGGAGNKTIMLLEGVITHWVFPRSDTNRWDTCAPEALLRACGGNLVDTSGNLYDYAGSEVSNFNGVVAARSNNAWQRCASSFHWS
eukprot:TRINITY_DN5841_c0_g3_i1.p1 TRINITY_DN5841_c0_g3~~TRINITY_DN5841_c0_g3_i1.p1  ORF type:complete len:444 (-),score=67.10 TRINITY_DN5841_c0_g3_i1:170-1501(-)